MNAPGSELGVIGAAIVAMSDTLTLHPVTLAEAKAYIERHHRHHPAPVGHRFSIGVADQDAVVRGVIVVGRPVARHYDDGLTAEVTRCCTDGTRNAPSILYGAAWRAAKALGYRRLITYTRADESGASLRGAGWTVIAQLSARPGWSCASRPRVDTTEHGVQRTLWEMTT
ncbi:XF1762 family protein [Gordonia sihwensis]|uniref:XF1762 family protein n=1 Tax=Gordonia sihwensis TaxID=173559 RepID=UPI000AF0782F|nr:XF1762 family protein [Gordonia sihwensis]